MQKLLLIAFSVLALAASSVAFIDPPLPGNPYCGTAPYSTPACHCPAGQVHDEECKSKCFREYRVRMQLAYDKACNAYEYTNQNYATTTEADLDLYDGCMASAQTQAERQNCRAILSGSLNARLASLMNARTNIETTLKAEVAAAESQYKSCMEDCCEDDRDGDGRDDDPNRRND